MMADTNAEVVLVTGASGNVGREVVRALLELRRTGVAPHLRVRAGGRRARTADAAADDGVETVELDFERPATFRAAVGDATRLFLLRPPAIASVQRTLNALVDVAVTQGRVRHVVFLSVAGADRNTVVPHHAVEQHLLGSKLPDNVAVTILRPGFFAQNLRDAYRDDIRLDNRLYVPAGDARVAWVDVRDIAAVAAQRMTTPLPTGARPRAAPPGNRDGAGTATAAAAAAVPAPALAEPPAASPAGGPLGTVPLPWQEAFHLTGPAPPVTFAEVARLLSEALSRPIRYEAASVLGYMYHLTRRRRLPLIQAIVLSILHVGLRYGQAEEVDETLARCLGRPATSIAGVIQYTVHEEPNLWAPLLTEQTT